MKTAKGGGVHRPHDSSTHDFLSLSLYVSFPAVNMMLDCHYPPVLTTLVND